MNLVSEAAAGNVNFVFVELDGSGCALNGDLVIGCGEVFNVEELTGKVIASSR